MTTAATVEAPPIAKFHFSLSVANLQRSIDFYRALFDLQPAKQYHDYAKFELVDPPVIFSLTPHKLGPPGGVLGHAGLKVPSNEEIERTRLRLEAAGYAVECQQGAVCGYRRLDKLHVHDPDGTHWEIYVVEEEVAPSAIDRSLEGAAARVAEPATSEATSWEHFVTNPFPEKIPHADASLDEVRLVGTFNAAITDEQQHVLVREARRVLKPGGKVLVHGLMADRAFPGAMPVLPGLAAMVSRVPVQSTPMHELQEAGFVGLQITKYSGKAWFKHNGVELREVKILGWQPTATSGERRVLYKGPFASATDETGTIYRRGERVTVNEATWDLLRRGSAAENFLFLDISADTCS